MAGAYWPAPAKINLFLHVLGRRADGYHELQTLFQLLDYGDRIDLSVREDGRIERLRDVEGVEAEADLTVRAARRLQTESGTPLGADIRVTKAIPMGAGLGGGSSNCASVLVGLNRLWQLGLAEDRLAAIGMELGADVPVFIRGLTAWGEGIGERLEPITVGSIWYLVVVPRCHVSTAEVFGSPALTIS